MQIDALLLHEGQLGNRLSQSVQQQRRGEFALLLAMLSPDALDFSQFHLPKTAIDAKQRDEQTLRAELGAGPKQPLAPEEYNMLIGQNNAACLLQGGTADIRLRHCLTPEPLYIRDDKSHIPLEIMDNCELAVRHRVTESHIELENPRMDAAAFYDNLMDESIHQPLYLSA